MNFTKITLGAASLLAAAAFAAPAFADGMPSRGRIASSEPARMCSTAGNVGVTSDYVFRGISQSNEEAAIQGGVDFTCGKFYAGFWGSSVGDFVNENGSEIDLYAGYKFATGPINWDAGFIFYAYPGFSDANNFELKLGASGDVWRGGTLGATVFYSTEFEYTVLEGTFSQALPKVAMFSPTFSATVGSLYGDDSADDYTYWNAGVALGFLDKWSLDLRYWDTDGEGVAGLPTTPETFSDERFVATLKYTF